MRIVVTGGAGFIGSALARTLIGSRNDSVLVIDKITARSSLASLEPVSQSPRFALRKADIADTRRIAALLQAFAPDAVIDATGDAQASLGATRSLLDATSAYWSSLPEARQEAFRFLSVSQAGARSSALAEDVVSAWHKSRGVPALCALADETYGPYQFPSARVARQVIERLDGADDITLARDDAAVSLLHLDDHVAALVAMIEQGVAGTSYRVGGRSSASAAELEETIARLVERYGPRPSGIARAVRPRLVSPAETAVCPSVDDALHRDTGWRAQTSLDSGLSQTVRWYLANESWWRPLVDARRAGDPYGLLRIA